MITIKDSKNNLNLKNMIDQIKFKNNWIPNNNKLSLFLSSINLTNTYPINKYRIVHTIGNKNEGGERVGFTISLYILKLQNNDDRKHTAIGIAPINNFFIRLIISPLNNMLIIKKNIQKKESLAFF